MPAMDERSHRTERRTKSPHPNSLANLRLVQPGQPSLNPGERPKVPAEVREAAMALTPDAIRVLGEIMNDPKAPPARAGRQSRPGQQCCTQEGRASPP